MRGSVNVGVGEMHYDIRLFRSILAKTGSLTPFKSNKAAKTTHTLYEQWLHVHVSLTGLRTFFSL